LCGQTEPVEKVSKLYLTGIGLRDETNTSRINPTPAARALSRRLAPPSGGRPALTRPVNPDLAILAFSAILPIFLYGIWTSQREIMLPAVLILVIFYGLFFWQRKHLLARYQKDLDSRHAAVERVKQAVGRWMKLYYCAADAVVFEPGKGEPVSLDLLPEILLEKS
jgi:hypothetical protein